ncbi:PQQ-dependent sugar dehydrogenase [Idiomarina xiamenensis]|uniref:L-sorbosone dehydrogenase (SNDH) n=1 Tax=Idiomarina xiamenensis 10-D-4 TaxID=740709 RepID=K2KAY4_9GAMM|nr:PQQ-dependent sugar dehydrogenase [Idiomarina xiamenensis]EKE83692.1 L-sorbosone dehydrogenase (SNDH) [Idiomarina xiamenensis 10-D-4]
MRCLPLMAFTALTSATAQAQTSELPLDKLTLPDGFAIEVYVDDVENARQMALGNNGTLFIGTRDKGDVYAVLDTDGDGKPDRKRVIGSELYMPSGLTYHDGDLYVAEVNQIRRYENIEQQLQGGDELAYSIFFDQLPDDRHHGWKYIDFGPDGHLYVPVGAPCNICDEDEPYASILKVAKDGSGYEVYAKGVRNSVGFDWHPQTGVFYFTDNGRDMMGDNTPYCELNRAPEEGMHFGYPYFHEGDVADPEFGKGKQASDYEPPVAKLGPHVAPLGMHFYDGDSFPEQYRGAFIAEHGSWNRSEKIGYRVKMAQVEDGKVTAYKPFIEGWLQPGEEVWGRPVALLELADGSLLISDDYAGVVYRVSYNGAE